MTFFERRRQRKGAADLLRHARFVRSMREDITSADDLSLLTSSETVVRESMRTTDLSTLSVATGDLEDAISKIMPARRFPVIREYVEIFAVALGVAMGCRAYFVQPYKIPTGSMQPTLWGITHHEQENPGLTDRMPLKLAKWIVTGEWYSEVRAKTSGTLNRVIMAGVPHDQSVYDIDGTYHELPRGQESRIATGTDVKKGDVLWSGIKVSGDHVFVNRMAWHYRAPRRSEVSVFETDGIEGVRPNTHYIKRMIALPGDSLAIEPPGIRINGEIWKSHGIGAISASSDGGYREPPVVYGSDGALKPTYLPPGLTQTLSGGEYVMFGDNTSSSHDSRYWGVVPEANLVGPASSVYWPFWRRSDGGSVNCRRIRR